MPRFDFRCPTCQNLEEYWVAFQALDLLEENGVPRCRYCGQGPMTRLLAAPAGIIFRGTGWASKS